MIAKADNQSVLPPAALRLLSREGVSGELSLELLRGGRNNLVYRVRDQAGYPALVLKSYFKHPDDPRDRCATEFSFLSFLWDQGLRCVPRPVRADCESGHALYEYIDGEALTESDVTLPAVREAVGFFAAMNSRRFAVRALKLAPASEACFGIASHLACARARVDKLAAAARYPAMDGAARGLIETRLLPAWEMVRQKVEAGCRKLELSLSAEIPLQRRVLSPSDFGFHNAVRRPGGELCFLDFEYAGWDDVAKTVCDFSLQPSVRVPPDMASIFADEVLAVLCDTGADRGMEEERIRLLLPVHRLKWTCIILNDFLPLGDSRRVFSLGTDDSGRRKQKQLDLAAATIESLYSKEKQTCT